MGRIFSEDDWEKIWATMLVISYKDSIDGDEAVILAKKHNDALNMKLDEINRKLDYLIERLPDEEKIKVF